MKALIFSFLFLSSYRLDAIEIKIHYNNFQSTITSLTDKTGYKDSTTDLSIQKKSCNAHIAMRLFKELSHQSKNLSLEKAQGHPMSVTVDGVKYTIEQRSSKGQFFHQYIDVIKEAKLEEMLSCK